MHTLAPLGAQALRQNSRRRRTANSACALQSAAQGTALWRWGRNGLACSLRCLRALWVLEHAGASRGLKHSPAGQQLPLCDNSRQQRQRAGSGSGARIHASGVGLLGCVISATVGGANSLSATSCHRYRSECARVRRRVGRLRAAAAGRCRMGLIGQWRALPRDHEQAMLMPCVGPKAQALLVRAPAAAASALRARCRRTPGFRAASTSCRRPCWLRSLAQTAQHYLIAARVVERAGGDGRARHDLPAAPGKLTRSLHRWGLQSRPPRPSSTLPEPPPPAAACRCTGTGLQSTVPRSIGGWWHAQRRMHPAAAAALPRQSQAAAAAAVATPPAAQPPRSSRQQALRRRRRWS